MAAWQNEKDVGWSWLILIASFFTQMITLGTVLCFGIYFVIMKDDFKCSSQELAGIGGAAYGVLCLAGPISGFLYRKFGCRPVVIGGGILSSFGLLISSLAVERWHLYLSYGLLNGFGLGLAYTPSVGIIGDYFEKYRFFATAFVSIGAAVGTLILSPFLLYVIEMYHWRGSMVIAAGLALQLVVCGCVMRSRSRQKDLGFRALLEIDLLKDTKFLLLCIHGYLIGGTCFIAFSFLAPLAMDRGLTLTASALLISVTSAFNGLGRCVASVIGHCPCTDRLLYFTITSGLCGFGALVAPLCVDFVSFAFVLGWFGLHFGMTFSQMPGVAIDLFGIQKLVNAVGYYICAVGIGGVTLPPIAGRLKDQTSTADSAFILAGVAGVFACLADILVFVIRFKERKNTRVEIGTEMNGVKNGQNA